MKFSSFRSFTLVLIQFSLLLIIGLFSVINIVTFLLIIPSVIIGTWAVFDKRFSVNVSPDPTENMKLVTSGPYSQIRHPMYLSVILFTLGFVLTTLSPIIVVAWLLLVGNFMMKIEYEEELLIKEFGKEYKKYQKETNKLIPGLY